jgi:hypothetical protein
MKASPGRSVAGDEAGMFGPGASGVHAFLCTTSWRAALQGSATITRRASRRHGHVTENCLKRVEPKDLALVLSADL